MPAAHVIAIAGARHLEEVVFAPPVRLAWAGSRAGCPAGADLPLRPAGLLVVEIEDLLRRLGTVLEAGGAPRPRWRH